MDAHDVTLILLALASIAALVLLVTRWKINAFIALLISALMLGAGAILLGANPKLTMTDVLKAFQDGLGATLASTAGVIGLGVMLGKLLAESGGAEVLAKRFNQFFGPQRVGRRLIALAVADG